MRDPRRSLLCLCMLSLVCCLQTRGVAVAVASREDPPALRRLQDGAQDAPAPVFCLDVGVEIAFPSQDVLDTLDLSTAVAAGTSCLRNPLMAAVVTHLKPSLRAFSVHAVDCVLEPLDAESSTVALFGVVSVCSRSNMETESDLAGWGHDAKAQVDALFESEPRITVGKTTGLRRHVLLSPSYALPVSGNALPQLILGETQIWSDGDEDGGNKAVDTDSRSFFTHVKLDVRNDGAIPLHLYRLTLVDRADGEGGTTSTEMMAGSVLPLVMPAVVQPGTSDVITFKAITSTAVASSKSYSLYISHSGFRAHMFTGMLDGTSFLAREKPFRGEEDDGDGAFARLTMDSDSMQSLFSSFPYATWRVASVVIVLAVGLAVAWYSRRKFVGFRAVKRALASCVQSKARKPASSSSGKTGSSLQKPARAAGTTTRVSASRAAITGRGEDHIEMESLVSGKSAAKPRSGEAESRQTPTPTPSTRMPAITMQWKAPPSPAPAPASTASKAPLAAPKLMTEKVWRLDLDAAAKLHPKRFESMWDEYVERFQVELSETKIPKSDELVAKLEARGVSCMASGTVNGVDKYVFYGKQRGCSWFYLITVDITVATANAMLSVRTNSDTAEELVQQLVQLIRAALADTTTC